MLMIWAIFVLPRWQKEEKSKLEEAMKNALEAERTKHPVPRTPHPNYDVRKLSSEELLDLIERRRDAEERARWR
jgi:hypothetical protein